MKKVLLIGANSFVAKRIAEYFKDKYELIGTYHNNKNPALAQQLQLDITKKHEVEQVLKKAKPEVIIITAAISSTSEAEDKTLEVNVNGTSNIVNAVKEQKLDSKIIFFSSDQVFDGKKGFYRETDKPNPINAYGKSKLEAEKIVITCENHLILRCSLICGAQRGDERENFVIKFINSGKKMQVFKNAYRSPVYVKDIPRVIDLLIQKNAVRIVNLGGDQYLNYMEMAAKIEKIFNIRREYDIVNCEIPGIPKKLGVDNSLVKSITGFAFTGFDDMLMRMKKEIAERK
jgi:dTDP-4-dehydrorhamnose reductase